MPLMNASHDFLARRAVAESRRQTAIEAARRDYAKAAAAERALWENTVAAVRARLVKAQEPLEFVPEPYTVGSDKTIDAVLAEAGAARAAADRLPGAPDHATLAAVRERAIAAADQSYNSALAAGFPAE